MQGEAENINKMFFIKISSFNINRKWFVRARINKSRLTKPKIMSVNNDCVCEFRKKLT